MNVSRIAEAVPLPALLVMDICRQLAEKFSETGDEFIVCVQEPILAELSSTV